jgi:CheY-like chemotaxis protein
MHRILHVEDDEAICRLVRYQLRSLECTIDTAYNMREAFNLIWHNEYDAAICDINVPAGSSDIPDDLRISPVKGYGGFRGLNISKFIQRYKRKKIPIIYLTGQTERPALETAMQMGGEYYIDKGSGINLRPYVMQVLRPQPPGSGQLILLAGETGVGKTELANGIKYDVVRGRSIDIDEEANPNDIRMHVRLSTRRLRTEIGAYGDTYHLSQLKRCVPQLIDLSVGKHLVYWQVGEDIYTIIMTDQGSDAIRALLQKEVKRIDGLDDIPLESIETLLREKDAETGRMNDLIVTCGNPDAATAIYEVAHHHGFPAQQFTLVLNDHEEHLERILTKYDANLSARTKRMLRTHAYSLFEKSDNEQLIRQIGQQQGKEERMLVHQDGTNEGALTALGFRFARMGHLHNTFKDIAENHGSTTINTLDYFEAKDKLWEHIIRGRS